METELACFFLLFLLLFVGFDCHWDGVFLVFTEADAVHWIQTAKGRAVIYRYIRMCVLLIWVGMVRARHWNTVFFLFSQVAPAGEHLTNSCQRITCICVLCYGDRGYTRLGDPLHVLPKCSLPLASALVGCASLVRWLGWVWRIGEGRPSVQHERNACRRSRSTQHQSMI